MNSSRLENIFIVGIAAAAMVFFIGTGTSAQEGIPYTEGGGGVSATSTGSTATSTGGTATSTIK